MADPTSVRVARHKAAQRVLGGAVTSVTLSPASVDAAAFLVASGWAPSRNEAINRAVQALAEAQRLVKGTQ